MAKSLASSSRILLEVERKFCGLAIPQLTTYAGSPGFRSLHDLAGQTIKDTYFDTNALLSSHGIWIRKRRIAGMDATWEAKCRQGGSYNNSMFEEVTNRKTIAHIVQSITGHLGTAEDDFGLAMIADMVTQRRSWLADDRFKIVLDQMDFGHEVGEVELERTLMLPQERSPAFDVQKWKQNISKSMDLEVGEFMKRYHWAFRPGIPKGKLTAYFEQHC